MPAATIGHRSLGVGGSGRHANGPGEGDGIERIGTSRSSYPAKIRKSESVTKST
jgi:hypothetical protein